MECYGGFVGYSGRCIWEVEGCSLGVDGLNNKEDVARMAGNDKG